ncbi:MAG: ABC transporter ATP-binding protein [Candidatus Palauibacterales bacterium]|nr:ABC transporter ATP-binding protein [Candidatus Palauibacterales bacterium]
MIRPTMPVRLDVESPVVETTGLVKRFGETAALSGLDLQVPEGAVYVLVGPNGAGKTTALRVLLDLLRPDAGRAELFGMEPRERPGEVRARIGYVPERQDFHYGWIRVRDLIDHHARYHPRWDPGYAGDLIEELEVPTDRKYARLSKGQARRVQLVLALAHRPPLLLLDEPTDGLDPVGKKKVLGLVADHLASTPTTVLVSTHLVYEAERLGDHLGVMKEGRLTAQLPREKLRDRMHRYLLRTPDGRDPVEGADLEVLQRKRAGRELQLTVWGERSDVVGRLEQAGAEVREASPLSLEESALALLGADERSAARTRREPTAAEV